MSQRQITRHSKLVTSCSFRISGYTLAIMSYEIVLAPEAVEDMERLKANLRAQVRDALEVHLRHEPAKTSKSRIKRLRGLSKPQYRLRVDEIRVFYDIDEGDKTVEILAIIPKSEAADWLTEWGETDDASSTI